MATVVVRWDRFGSAAVRWGRLGCAGLIVIAVGSQLVWSMRLPVFVLANFFSYFTNLANLFTAGVFVAMATIDGRSSRRLDLVRGAATLCMAMVGIIFSLLLTGIESDLIGWVNVVLHYVMPVVVVLDWIVNPPRTPFRMHDALLWLALPLAYVIYTLGRGALVHWYPYPFLDVGRFGLEVVGGYLGVMLFGTVVLAAVLVIWGVVGQRRVGVRRVR